jgi:hypothetical protein
MHVALTPPGWLRVLALNRLHSCPLYSHPGRFEESATNVLVGGEVATYRC